MSKLTVIADAGTVSVTGRLTRHYIDKAFVARYQKALGAIELVDLAQVSKVDTAGLAWLLSVIEQNGTKGQIKFKNLPDGLLQLAQLSGVDHFLSLA